MGLGRREKSYFLLNSRSENDRLRTLFSAQSTNLRTNCVVLRVKFHFLIYSNSVSIKFFLLGLFSINSENF